MTLKTNKQKPAELFQQIQKRPLTKIKMSLDKSHRAYRESGQRSYLNMITAQCEKPIANIIPNGVKLEAISLKSGMKQGCPLFPHPLQYCTGSTSWMKRQEKKIKGVQVGKIN